MMPTQPETVGDVFADAATVIRERGWCQDVASLPSGEVCIGLAVSIAAWSTWPFAWSIYWHLRRHMGTRLIGAWNDQPERTITDVLRLLESAAWTYNDQVLMARPTNGKETA